MPIRYYPNRTYKGVVPAIDRELAKRDPKTVNQSQDVSATGINYILSANDNWQIDSISFEFSAATARNYSAKIMNGRQIVSNLNDYLWIQIQNVDEPQKIVLDPGFYTGTQMATQLQTQLNANTSFSTRSITFVVAYNGTTGLFTITPSSGSVRYLNVNTAKWIDERDSIAGFLFGFEATSAYGASISSDTAVGGLDSEAAFIAQTASVLLEHYHDDLHTMSMDQALHIETSVAAPLTVDFTVVYEILI